MESRGAVAASQWRRERRGICGYLVVGVSNTTAYRFFAQCPAAVFG